MPAIIASRSTRVVVVDANTAVAIVQNRPVIAVAPTPAKVIEATARGPQGPKGDPGVSAAGLLPPIDFAFGDASPRAVLTLSATSEVVAVSLQIEQAFDGAGAQVQLGTLADPGLLMPANENAPDMLATFERVPRVELPAGTVVYLSVTPGAGASQGRGQFVVTAVPSA